MNVVLGTGTFGSALAISISYAHTHSTFWAILDGLLSWIFVFYSMFAYYN